ncbi:MAG: hypothetical protein IJB33_01945 [Akkermansia sp.]|nr:hypothetical protein [Akkermansia sp.]
MTKSQCVCPAIPVDFDCLAMQVAVAAILMLVGQEKREGGGVRYQHSEC